MVPQTGGPLWHYAYYNLAVGNSSLAPKDVAREIFQQSGIAVGESKHVGGVLPYQTLIIQRSTVLVLFVKVVMAISA